MRKYPIVSCLTFITFVAGASLQAQTNWDGGGIGDDWSTPENWEGDAIPGDTAVAQTLNGAATINVTTDVQANYFSNQVADSSLVTLNLNSGSLTENGLINAGRFSNGTNTVINIDGGSLIAGADANTYGPTSGNGILTYNITAGGIYGYKWFRYDTVTVNLSGGVLDMGSSSASTSLSFVNSAVLNMSGTGTFIFDIFGNGNNDSLGGTTGSSAINMSGGIIGFRFVDGYAPQIGDTYDFLRTSTTVVDPDAANVATTDVDGKYSIVWDTSNWLNAHSSTLGILTIQSITAIPEPSTYALMAGGLSLALLGLRRRR